MVRPGSPARGQRPGLRRPPRVVLPPPGTQGLHVRPRVSSWLRGAWASGRRHTRGTRAHGLQGTAGPRPEEPLASGLANPTRGGGLGPAPGPSCPRQEASIIEATEQGHPLRGRASSSRGHSRYRGAAGCGRPGDSGARARSLPVFLFTPQGRPRKRGSVIFLVAIISLAGRCDFPGPFFLSVSTVTRAGRKRARVSDNCAKGSRKRAGGKQVSTGSSRLPPAPTAAGLPKGSVRRAWRPGRPPGFLTDSGEKTQAPRGGQRKHGSGLRPPDVMGTTGSASLAPGRPSQASQRPPRPGAQWL